MVNYMNLSFFLNMFTHDTDGGSKQGARTPRVSGQMKLNTILNVLHCMNVHGFNISQQQLIDAGSMWSLCIFSVFFA